MEKSEAINELAKALVAAQSEIKGAHKDSVNPFFKSSYADLSSVWNACREPLNKHGLAISQILDETQTRAVLITMLIHTSGQWIAGRFPITPVKNDPQSVGSALSYARRYALAAIVGVVTTDDDAETAHNRSQPILSTRPAVSITFPTTTPPRDGGPINNGNGTPAVTPRKGYGPVTITDPQIKRLIAIGYSNGYTVQGIDTLMHSKFQHSSKKELRRDEYDWLCDYIQKNPAVDGPEDTPF